MPSGRIRTILIDDSAFMRKVIGDILRSDSDIELVGVATNGRQGSEMALELKPDVLITDIVMPDFDGMYVVSSVMEKQPMPIILLSSLDKTDSRIFDALRHGAFEFIDKPTDVDRGRIHDYKLLDLIKEASRTDISLLKARQLAGKKNSHQHSFGETLNYAIIAIGASTGGPGAVEMIINNLPRNLQIPVVIAQHMPHRFLETFAQRLNEQSPLPVHLATRGDVKGGIIHIAPGEANLRIERNINSGLPTFTFTDQHYTEFNNPSVDCLFESVAEVYGQHSIGVILTGMGKDGTKGMAKMKERGGFTIAQDEESSVVYGMPKVAFESGAARRVVSLKQIPGYIVSCL